MFESRLFAFIGCEWGWTEQYSNSYDADAYSISKVENFTEHFAFSFTANFQ
tara:strand:+ start:141 stop:293 length:153 start_codon:yes stop_codon:yes gene_type:complete